MTSPKPLSNLLLSIQRALIGKVTPNLRAVYAFMEGDIYGIIFYYNQSLSKEEEELVSFADTVFISDCFDYETSCSIEVLPYPKPIPKKGHCVYMRYEKQEDD